MAYNPGTFEKKHLFLIVNSSPGKKQGCVLGTFWLNVVGLIKNSKFFSRFYKRDSFLRQEFRF